MSLKQEIDAQSEKGGSSVGGAVGGATPGSVFFAGAGGVLAQDNANFFWEDAVNQLRLQGDTVLRVYNASGSFFSNNLVEFRSQGYGNSSYIGVGEGASASMSIFTGTNAGGTGYLRVGSASLADNIFQFFTGTGATQQFLFTVLAAGVKGQVIKLAASPTANAFEVQPSGSTTPLMAILPAGGILMQEQTDPTAPATNNGILYTKDNGAGKTQLVVRFPTGVVQILATEP